MILRPPRSTRTATLFPYTTLFRSDPRFAIFGILADMHQINEDLPEGEREGLAQALALSVAQNLTSRTYLQCLNELIEALGTDDARKLEQWWFRRGGYYVPHILARSEEHPSEIQSLMRNTYPVIVL